MDVHTHALRKIISIWLQHKHLFSELQECSEKRPNLATPKSVVKHTAKITLNAMLTYRKQVFKRLCLRNADGRLVLDTMATELMFKECL